MNAKQRGLKRKCRGMVRRIEEETAVFPQHPRDCDFWHLHLPVGRDLVDSRATPFGVRRLCVQTLIRRAGYVRQMAPPDEEVHVVVAVTLPELWSSQIIVFFGRDYFRGFFDRTGDEQTWTLTSGLLAGRWGVDVPSGFTERVYDEELREGAAIERGQVWFVGELEA